MKNICVIPARGGSKRIPRKNIRPFCGKPMLAWAVDRAKESGLFDGVIVSTDDDEIAALAESLGAEVPFLRPAELSGDFVGTYDVVKHAIDWFQQSGLTLDRICCTYATTPFLTVEDLRRGGEALDNEGTQLAFGATEFPYPIQRAFRIDENHVPSMFQPSFYESRSQDLEDAYHDAGQFLWGTADAWMNNVHPFGPASKAVIIPRFRIQDIDTPDDWIRAEFLMKAIQNADQMGKTTFE